MAHSRMKFNPLGETGIRLSHISLGGAAFSNIYRKFDEAKGIELIRESLREGINYIDTGPWYGQGSSEITCGKALQGLPRDSFYIGSKVGRYELEVEKMFDFSAERSHSSLELSLQRLGLDYVDIIQVHDVTFAPDVSLVVRETLPALAREVAAGRARHVGLADYDLSLLRDIVEESEVKVASVLSYARSTIIDNSLQKYIDFFQESGVELARLAQWFTLQQPRVSTHVAGVQSSGQLAQALDVLRTGITDHERRVLADIQDRYFKGQTMHWENVELPIYQEKLKAKIKA